MLDKISYTIQLASRLSGLSPFTIRAWEKRYHAFNPTRDKNGRRSYSSYDIERMKLLKTIVEFGHSISKITHHNNDELKELIHSYGKKVPTTINTQKPVDDICVESLTIILMALKLYNLDIISQELNKLKNLLTPKDFALKIVLPMMSELGAAVLNKEFSITHEHALSAIIKFHLGHQLYNAENNQKNKLFIICGIEGDYHEFGILIASLLVRHLGYQLIYLGPNMPHESLADAINGLNPDYTIIGTTKMVNYFGPKYIENYLSKLASKAIKPTQIIIGSDQEIIFKKSKLIINQLKSIEALDQFLDNL